jgi:hypothetical protein
MKVINHICVLVGLITFTCLADETETWVNDLSETTTAEFNASEPTLVPNYTEGEPNTSQYNDNNMADSATQASTSDDASRLIYSLGTKPDVTEQPWYKDATVITNDPSQIIDTTEGEYSDCETVTTPGDTYNTTENCTETELTETRTCARDQVLEVDANHYYECDKVRDTQTSDCNVGRTINVSQSHNYACRDGEVSYEKDCSETLNITFKEERNGVEPDENGNCPTNYMLYPTDGLCYPESQYTTSDAIPTCMNGTLNKEKNMCISPASWAEYYSNEIQGITTPIYSGYLKPADLGNGYYLSAPIVKFNGVEYQSPWCNFTKNPKKCWGSAPEVSAYYNKYYFSMSNTERNQMNQTKFSVRVPPNSFKLYAYSESTWKNAPYNGTGYIFVKLGNLKRISGSRRIYSLYISSGSGKETQPIYNCGIGKFHYSQTQDICYLWSRKYTEVDNWVETCK